MAKVKVCGLTDPEKVRFTAEAGADWIGFMFAPSVRRISFDAAAEMLPETGAATPVAVFVDPSDDDIDHAATLGFTILQLHGSETPERVAEIKAQTGLRLWKVVSVSEAIHLEQTRSYTEAAAYLIESKPPPGAEHAGGHGHRFDWSILQGWEPAKPWLLAGGLTPDNVAEAIRISNAGSVDVSSGVERMRGLKDEALVREFIRRARQG